MEFIGYFILTSIQIACFGLMIYCVAKIHRYVLLNSQIYKRLVTYIKVHVVTIFLVAILLEIIGFISFMRMIGIM